MKQYFASFITKPLKHKICFNTPAVNDNLKVLRFSVVSYSTNINIKSTEMLTFFEILTLFFLQIWKH